MGGDRTTTHHLPAAAHLTETTTRHPRHSRSTPSRRNHPEPQPTHRGPPPRTHAALPVRPLHGLRSHLPADSVVPIEGRHALTRGCHRHRPTKPLSGLSWTGEARSLSEGFDEGAPAPDPPRNTADHTTTLRTTRTASHVQQPPSGNDATYLQTPDQLHARSPPSGVLDPLTRAASPAPDSAPSRSLWPPAIGPASPSSAALPRAAAPTSSEPPSPADATYLQAPSHLRSAPSPSDSATPVQAHPQPRRRAAPSHPSRAPGQRPRVTLLARQTPPRGNSEQSHSRKAEPRLLRPLPLTRVTPHPLRPPLLPP